MSRPKFDYKIKPDYTVTGPCVYKLTYQGKYIFVKAKDHCQSIKTIQRLLRQYLDGSEAARKPDSLYYFFFKYIEAHAEGEFYLNILLTSENPYDLLVMEQQLLDRHRKDKKCLNNQVEAYIPLYNEITMQYGWIDKGSVLNFKKWLKSHRKARKALQ